MAGGSGTRFWPLSRRACPKQLLPLWGGKTLIELTVERLESLTTLDRIYIVTGEHLEEQIAGVLPDLPRENIIVEPCARNTLPCIALAAEVLGARDPNATFGIFAADAWIDGIESFVAAANLGYDAAEAGKIATMGITPTRPETGYGYIRQAVGEGAVRAVDAFVEKPDAETAEAYFADDRYFWNAGIFFLSTAKLATEMRRQQPEMQGAFDRIGAGLRAGDDATVRKTFESVTSVSIDYGIMEGASDVVVVPTRFEWNDVGHWAALDAVLPADDDGNVVDGDACVIDTRGSVVVNSGEDGRLLAVVGLEDVVVVQTADATLVLPKGQAQRVREVVAWLKESERSELL